MTQLVKWTRLARYEIRERPVPILAKSFPGILDPLVRISLSRIRVPTTSHFGLDYFSHILRAVFNRIRGVHDSIRPRILLTLARNFEFTLRSFYRHPFLLFLLLPVEFEIPSFLFQTIYTFRREWVRNRLKDIGVRSILRRGYKTARGYVRPFSLKRNPLFSPISYFFPSFNASIPAMNFYLLYTLMCVRASRSFQQCLSSLYLLFRVVKRRISEATFLRPKLSGIRTVNYQI